MFFFFWKLVGSVDSFVPKDFKTFGIYSFSVRGFYSILF